MSVYFARLRPGYPNPPQQPQDWEGSWKVYTVCTTHVVTSCSTRADANNLPYEDKLNARRSYVTLVNRAQTGENLTELYDEKKCHEAHTFKHDHQEVKIFRIWGAGAIRVYFLYLPGKRLVTLKTWAKRRDKLTDGEKLELEQIARTVLQCVKDYSFEAREI